MTLDLFGSQTVVGLTVKLDRPVDREKPCCRNICVIGVGKGRTPVNFVAPTAGNIAVGCPSLPRTGSSMW